MAQGEAKVPASSDNKKMTVAELRQWYEEEQRRKARYDTAKNGLNQLRDATKSSTKTVSSFSKESLRSYLQNIGNNERNLRNLSRYLYYRCQAYYRLIMYNANMFCLDARSVIPQYDLTKENNSQKVLKSYQDTLNVLDTLNLQYEFLKIYSICFREDVFYGACYYDETGMFVYPIDPDYAKISGQYQTGDFAFHVDMTYFRSRQELLEYLGEPFKSMYRDYESSGQKWQPMQEEYAVCLKARAEDWEVVIPVFAGLLNQIIGLTDIEDVQAIADEQEIYKMIWLELETISGSNEVDDWKVDPTLVIEYFNRMINEALPDYTSAAIVPGKLETISFDNDKANDTNKVAKSTETVFNSAGGAQILNSATVKGTTAFKAAIKADTEFAISMLLPQTQAWVNRFLSYHISSPAKVKFFEISTYTKEDFKKSLLQDAQYGLPTKLAINALNGFSEKDTLALNFLEEECLQLSQKFVPLQSSHTQSGQQDAGRPKTDNKTDDGEASEEKRDNANG